MPVTALILVLLAARILALSGRALPLTLWSPPALLWHDAALVLAFAIACQLLRRRPRLTWALYVAAVGYVVLNIPVIRVLATPLTWPMLLAARGTLSDSILYYASWQNIAITASAAFVGVYAPRIASRWNSRRPLAVTAAVAMLGPIAAQQVDMQGLERNAWSALLISALPKTTAQAAAAEWRSGAEPLPTKPLPHLKASAAGRNIVLISLESTAAEYLGLYGAMPDVMPNLTRLAQTGVVFEHAYAVYPESIKGLFTMLCSVYPALDTSTQTLAAWPCRSIAALLAERGYRTALFHSGRFMYLGMHAVVRHRGFHTLADAGDIGGNHNSSFGVDEPATVARILEWVDALPSRQKFFLTYLPIAGHHPYETPEPGPDSDTEDFGRYRNALRYADASVGALIEGLQLRGLFDDTVWVIVGDHGEAFGQHPGNFGHTFQIYEENMRVPFVISVPGSPQERSAQVVSLVDLAPTVLDLAGVAAPANYQGRSAISGEPLAALFFADYSQTLLGLRDGRWKFIHNASTNRSRLFDLKEYHGERKNLAESHRGLVSRYRDVVLGWTSAQKFLLKSQPMPNPLYSN